MKKYFAVIMVCIGLAFDHRSVIAQIKTFQFEQIDSLQRIESRNIFVFIHTDWCKYCQAMKYTTFKNDRIINLLNENFYFVDLNAEEKRNIDFNNYTFKFKPTGKIQARTNWRYS